MTDRELMQQALNCLTAFGEDIRSMTPDEYEVIAALRARLAQPEPEPVAWADRHDIDREGHDFHASRQKPSKDGVPLYTAPPQREITDDEFVAEAKRRGFFISSPQRKWQGLTNEELKDIFDYCQHGDIGYVAAMVEAKLKEKNSETNEQT